MENFNLAEIAGIYLLEKLSPLLEKKTLVYKETVLPQLTAAVAQFLTGWERISFRYSKMKTFFLQQKQISSKTDFLDVTFNLLTSISRSE